MKQKIKVNYNGKEEIITRREFERRLFLGTLPVFVTNSVYQEIEE